MVRSLSKPSSKAKILIIDDDPDTNNLYKILRYDNFHVDTFMDPIDALYHFKPDKYDLIFLALKMKRIDGFAIFQALKKIDENVTICFMTADDMSSIEQLKEKIPNIEKYVIDKPILPRNLKNKIYELVSKK